MPMCQQTERCGNIVPDRGRWEHRTCSCPGLRHGSAQGHSLTFDLPVTGHDQDDGYQGFLASRDGAHVHCLS